MTICNAMKIVYKKVELRKKNVQKKTKIQTIIILLGVIKITIKLQTHSHIGVFL